MRLLPVWGPANITEKPLLRSGIIYNKPVMHPVQQVQYLVPVSSGGTVLRPGMLVRGRVVPSAGGMVFEHSGGKMPLAGDGARETGWKLWRVEARNDGLVVREVPARVQPAGFSPAAGLTRLVTALFADKAVRRQVLAAM